MTVRNRPIDLASMLLKARRLLRRPRGVPSTTARPVLHLVISRYVLFFRDGPPRRKSREILLVLRQS